MRQILSVGLGMVLLGGTAGLLRAGGDQAELRQILNRAIKAEGGQDKVAKLQAFTWKGKADLEAGGNPITLLHEVTAQGWDHYRLDLEIQVNGRSTPLLVVVKGDKIWRSVNGNVKDISKDREAGFVRGFLYGLRVPQMLSAVVRDKDAKLSHLGELKVGERDAVGLSISRKGRPDVSLFFDKQNGLPIKSSVRLTVPAGQEKEFEFLFRDYKDEDGLKHCRKITIRLDGQDYLTELSEVRALGEVDASLFEQP